MYEILNGKTAYLAVGQALPVIEQSYECSIITTDTISSHSLEQKSIFPKRIENINGNIVKIDTAFNEVFFVMLPVLPNDNVYFIEIAEVPYIGTILECKILNSTNPRWIPSQCEKIEKIAKLSDRLFLLETSNARYFALKE